LLSRLTRQQLGNEVHTVHSSVRRMNWLLHTLE
jgi:hypothetical protein